MKGQTWADSSVCQSLNISPPPPPPWRSPGDPQMHQVDSRFLFEYLCSFTVPPPGQSDGEALLGDSTRRAGPAQGREAFSLGNAFLDSTFNVQRKRGVISSSRLPQKVRFPAPAFKRPPALF